MKKIIAVAVAGLALSTGAFAGTFDGVNADLGIGGSYTQSKQSGFTAVDDPSDPLNALNVNGTTSQGDFTGIASIGYSQEISNGFNLAANLFYQIGHQRAGSTASSMIDPSNNANTTMSVSSKLNNTWGISVEPGYYFGKDTLGYVKLAWVNSGLTTNASLSQDGVAGGGSLNQTTNINGFGYGLGVKQAITENIYLKGEVYGVTYGSANVGEGGLTSKPSQVSAFLSVGYKF